MEIHEDRVTLPNQKEATRSYVKHPGGAAMLAVTKDEKVVLIKQFRYPLNEIIYEIPAGKMDVAHESFFTCAKRELEEETGYTSTEISFLYQIYPCVGYSDEKIEIYYAKNAYQKIHPIAHDLDEFIEVYLFTKDEIKELFNQNLIKDGKTIIALSYWINQ